METDTRIAEIAVRFSLMEDDGLLHWLECITGRPVERMGEGEWKTTGPDGMVIGISCSDPVAVTVQASTAIAGLLWPFVFPDVLKETSRLWTEARKGGASLKRPRST